MKRTNLRFCVPKLTPVLTEEDIVARAAARWERQHVRDSRVRNMWTRPLYYYRDGTPIRGDANDPQGTFTWARLYEDIEYRRVAASMLPNGVFVSTVWMGLDHSFLAAGQPIIFETMAFGAEVHRTAGKFFPAHDYHEELACDRYATEEQAVIGHMRMCERMFAGCRTLTEKVG